MEVVRLHSNLARFLCHGLGFKTVANLITLDALTSVARVSLLLTYPYLSDLFPLPPNSETALCTSAYGQNRMDHLRFAISGVQRMDRNSFSARTACNTLASQSCLRVVLSLFIEVATFWLEMV